MKKKTIKIIPLNIMERLKNQTEFSVKYSGKLFRLNINSLNSIFKKIMGIFENVFFLVQRKKS